MTPSTQHHQHSSANARSPACRRAELSSAVHHNLCHNLTPTPNTEHFFTDFNNVAWDNDTTSPKENFPTAPLHDEVWSDDQIPDRHLCIHETPHEPNHQCSYPCTCKNTTFRMDHNLHQRIQQYLTVS